MFLTAKKVLALAGLIVASQAEEFVCPKYNGYIGSEHNSDPVEEVREILDEPKVKLKKIETFADPYYPGSAPCDESGESCDSWEYDGDDSSSPTLVGFIATYEAYDPITGNTVNRTQVIGNVEAGISSGSVEIPDPVIFFFVVMNKRGLINGLSFRNDGDWHTAPASVSYVTSSIINRLPG